MNKIPCAVIKDLLPSYIDGLTSEETKALVEEHLAECDGCRLTYQVMKENAEEAAKPTSEDRREIDFLKKNKRKNRSILWGSLGLALLMALIILFARLYLVGNEVSPEAVKCRVSGSGEDLVLEILPDGAKHSYVASEFSYSDRVEIEVKERLPILPEFLYGHDFDRNEPFEIPLHNSGSIDYITVNGSIVWYKGLAISPKLSAVYEAEHPYCGDPSANNRTADALGFYEIFGGFTNALQTAHEPYDWTIKLEENVEPGLKNSTEVAMRKNAYIILATVENLGSVTFEYHVDGHLSTCTVTADDATEFFGEDIKSCYDNLIALHRLFTMVGM